ncbi:MAG: 3-phosphoshikimate 1-carboxyvinyltransferase [Myxococcota bacterium]
MKPLPDELTIAPRGRLDARVRVPGSKSVTNRALLVAALARGESRLRGGLHSDDTVAMQRGLAALGCRVDAGEDPWIVPGVDGRFAAPQTPLDTQNSGTTARFLTAAATLAAGPVVIDGNARMRERPIDDLTRALEGLGASCRLEGAGGCPPVRVAGGGLPGGHARIDASRSSQFVSAVLLSAPYAAAPVTLGFEGDVVSVPYIDLTLEVMRDFGAEAGWRDARSLQVSNQQRYAGRDYPIEADASSAAYPFCAAAIAGGRVRVDGLRIDTQQPDLGILELLAQMGCSVERGGDWAAVARSGSLRGIDVDMNRLPDAVLALAVVACFADGPTHIRNVANLRIKETDRLTALETELRKLGVRADAGPDDLRIDPRPLRGAAIDTYDDHRMAMSFALAGLVQSGVVIRDPSCVSKTWPGFFDVFEKL